jgi:hypothetical protein
VGGGGGGGGGRGGVKCSCVELNRHITQHTKENGIIKSDQN